MKKIILGLATVLCWLPAFSQEALRGGTNVISPEVKSDNTVTFRLFAPDAISVEVTGDFLPPQTITNENGETAEVPGVAPLVKDNEGLWTYTTPDPLDPELYGYTFTVDGVRVLDPSNVYMNRDIATVTNLFLIDGGRAHYYKVNDVSHGNISRVWYNSQGLEKNRRMTIYTPPGYEDNKESYPVIYLLHGSGGDEEAWIALGRLSQIMDNLIAEGKAEPMIVVMTNGNPNQSAAPGENDEGFVKPDISNSRKNPKGQFESTFSDVVNYVDSHYRTKPDKVHRAIAGLSMGGRHTATISQYYPDMFDYVGLFSAAVRNYPDSPETPEVYRDLEGKLKTQFEKNPKLYFIAIGNKDFLYDSNKQFRELLDKKGYPYEYYESPGGHIWRNWRIYLTEFAPKLFK